MNNDVLYNAAYIGFICGVQSGRNPSSTTAADYLNLTQSAQAFATQVDSKIAEDALISAGGGTALAPTTATIQADQLARTSLMRGICEAIADERYYSSETALDYDALADVVAAQYTEALLLLVTP